MEEQKRFGTLALLYVMHLETGGVRILRLERPGAIKRLIGRDGG